MGSGDKRIDRALERLPSHFGKLGERFHAAVTKADLKLGPAALFSAAGFVGASATQAIVVMEDLGEEGVNPFAALSEDSKPTRAQRLHGVFAAHLVLSFFRCDDGTNRLVFGDDVYGCEPAEVEVQAIQQLRRMLDPAIRKGVREHLLSRWIEGDAGKYSIGLYRAARAAIGSGFSGDEAPLITEVLTLSAVLNPLVGHVEEATWETINSA